MRGLLRQEKSARTFSLVALLTVVLMVHAMLFAFSMQIWPMLVPLTPLIVGVTVAQQENDWSAQASEAPPGQRSEAVPPWLEVGVVDVE